MKLLAIGFIFLSLTSAYADDGMKPMDAQTTPTVTSEQNKDEASAKDKKAEEEEKAEKDSKEEASSY